MNGPLPPFPIPLHESGVRHDKMDNPNRMQRYVRLCDRLVVGVFEVNMLEDQHANELEVEMTREEMEARMRDLGLKITGMQLGTYTQEAEQMVEEYFELKQRLKNETV